MPLDQKAVVAQISDVLEKRAEMRRRAEFDDLSDLPDEELTAWAVLAGHTIKRFAPDGTEFRQQADGIAAQHLPDNAFAGALYAGVLEALRQTYDSGYLLTVQELVHADIFSDFLDMAEYFLSEGYKDASAVIAGGVLEEHLRKLCGKHDVAMPAKPKIDTMNSDLAKAAAYNKNEQKQITAWAGIRNDAAHGDYGKYGGGEVKLMVAGIRNFIARYPA